MGHTAMAAAISNLPSDRQANTPETCDRPNIARIRRFADCISPHRFGGGPPAPTATRALAPRAAVTIPAPRPKTTATIRTA